ncbi:MAG: type II secretion system protein N [Burkholderiaceae bacterium]
MPILRPADLSRRLSLILSAALLAALSALSVYWVLQIAAPRVSIAPGGSLVDQSGKLDTFAAGRLFGIEGQSLPQQARLPDNIRVIGVIASASNAAAILQVNGQPPAPYAIGQSVDGNLVVRGVSRDEVVLERNGEELRAPAPARHDPAILEAGAAGDRSGAPAAQGAGAPARSVLPAARARPPAQTGVAMQRESAVNRPSGG